MKTKHTLKKPKRRIEREEKRTLEAWLAKREAGYIPAAKFRSWAFGRRTQ